MKAKTSVVVCRESPWQHFLWPGGGDGTPADVSGPVGFLQVTETEEITQTLTSDR